MIVSKGDLKTIDRWYMILLVVSSSAVVLRGAAVRRDVSIVVGDAPGGNVSSAGTLGGSVGNSGAKRALKMSTIVLRIPKAVLTGAKTAYTSPAPIIMNMSSALSSSLGKNMIANSNKAGSTIVLTTMPMRLMMMEIGKNKTVRINDPM